MLKEMEIQHPCGKLLSQASTAQEFECGDCTNFTVMLAGALLAEAENLLKEGLHSSDVLRGYELGLKKCIEILEHAETESPDANGLCCWSLTSADLKDKTKVMQAIKSSNPLGQPIGTKHRSHPHYQGLCRSFFLQLIQGGFDPLQAG